jgi:hypothetical protein
MATPPARDGRLVRSPDRRIHEFDVYELEDGHWRAVYTADPSLVIEHADWRELFWACVSARISRTLQAAFKEWRGAS